MANALYPTTRQWRILYKLVNNYYNEILLNEKTDANELLATKNLLENIKQFV